jgi:putative AdoMet-dependent methyltransferase
MDIIEHFNDWTKTYDKDVVSMKKGYPFEGYEFVLDFIENEIQVTSETKILDLGIGTGTLTKKLYDKGAKITGVDFSSKMIASARAKMPNALFLCQRLNETLPQVDLFENFDYIISTYAIHHIQDEEKIKLFETLYQKLSNNGVILIADISFEKQEHLDDLKNKTTNWDDEEFYYVYEELNKNLNLPNSYKQLSICAGILKIEKDNTSSMC